MTCKCDIQLDKCRWPKCQYKDNEQYNFNGECMKTLKSIYVWVPRGYKPLDVKAFNDKNQCMILRIENIFDASSDYKTNQQATANHTAKMFNQSHTQWLASDGNPANEPKEIKMTRKEAIQKACSVTSNVNRYDIVNILEALGLIKFDEEKSLSRIIHEARMQTESAYSNCQPFMDYINEYGYKIVKK